MKTIPLLLAGLSGLALAAEPSARENTPPDGLSSSDWSSIRAAYEAGRHAVHRQENGTLAARNPGQQWHTDFDGKGFIVTPITGKFRLTMDWKKSTNLSDFLDFPAPPGSSVSINPQGDVEFEFTSPDNAAFFRVEVE